MARRRSPAKPPPVVPPGTLPLDAKTWKQVATALELSPQQKRIVELLLLGKRDKQIAADLELGLPTVRTYLGRIFLRMGVQDRVELILRVFTVSQAIKTTHFTQERCHPP